MRKAVEQDLERIVEIYNSTVASRTSTADTTPVAVESKRAWLLEHTDKRPLLVYEMDQQIIGWASFQDFYGRPAYHRTAELSIYLDAAYRGKGLGETILRECIAMCPQLGIANLVGFVFSHNQASLRLLEKFGFAKWGELIEVAEMDGKLYSLSILGLKLKDN